jgi:NTP pyrophosphatase (non-canonical NTP hydrolase)
MDAEKEIDEICFRAEMAHIKYGPIASTQEAMGVALEEWDEFREAIRSNNIAHARSEALDLAAVLLRFATQKEWPRG